MSKSESTDLFFDSLLFCQGPAFAEKSMEEPIEKRELRGSIVRLTLKKDQEYRLFISQQITNENEFMFPVYQRGLEALRSIVRQAKDFDCRDEIAFYGYCHNIIAFSGNRGQGKTSTMLSFSKAMKNSFQNENLGDEGDELRQCSFTVLPSIDPTVLEQDQSILAVILSRMYRLAENLWTNSCGKSDFSGCPDQDEAMRNQILRLFQRCLSGINSIKFREGKEIRGLVEIHEISDSSVLKKNFYTLINDLLSLTRRTRDKAAPFLVIQLDDTDFQTRKCYEIMEDIRKYLTIPNVVILMATDLNMLRIAMTQQSISDFQNGLYRDLINKDKLYRTMNKYLDKLIPPNHAVYLPHLDEVIREQNASLRISYLAKNGLEKEKDLLADPSQSWMLYNYSFQEFIFRYVYQKTRIAFIPQSGRAHSILPTTLRGFSQFFVTISSMRDVIEVTAHSDTDKLIEQVQEQLDALDKNLPLFENYFLNSWIHAKLTAKQAGTIETLMTMDPSLWSQRAVKELENIFQKAEDGDPLNELSQKFKNDSNKDRNLMLYLQQLEGMRLPPDDAYYVFAIRIFFELHFHKLILKRKRQAINSYQKKNGILLFDFSLDSTGLPNVPVLSTKETAFRDIIQDLRQDKYDRIIKNIKNGKKYAAHLLHPTKDIKQPYQFDPMGFIPFFLTLGAPDFREMMVGETNQGPIYLVQTTCATMAINSDVQIAVRKALKERAMPGETPKEKAVPGEAKLPYLTQLRAFFQAITDAIQSVNPNQDQDSKGKAPSMILSWMQEIVTLMDEGDNRSIFRNLLSRLKAELTQDHLIPLANIYNCAEKLSTALTSPIIDLEEIRTSWEAFVNLCRPYCFPDMKDGIDLYELEPLADPTAIGEDTYSAATHPFRVEFEKNFQKLCKQLDYTKKAIKEYLKDKENS